MTSVPILTGIKAQAPSHHPDPVPPRPAKPRAGDGTGTLNPYEMWAPTHHEWGYADAIKGSQPVDRGWDATKGGLGRVRKAAAINQANAVLTDGKAGFQMSIFVSNLAIDSALAGSTTQSQLVRDFYAHNFVQPDIIVTGWSLDQEDYGLLCEFVHSCQHKAITSNSSKWPDFMTQLVVFGRDGMKDKNGKTIDGTQRGINGNHRHGRKVSVSGSPNHVNDGDHFNQSIRGSHKSAVAKGYVSSMPREHRHFQNAVQWQFSFTVAAMIEGLYADGTPISVQVRQTWKDILADAKKVGVSTVTASENKASLAYAASNAATLTGQIPSGATTGGGSSGGGGGGGGGASPATQNNPLPSSCYGPTRGATTAIVLHSSEIAGGPGYVSTLMNALKTDSRGGINPTWDPSGTGLSVHCCVNSDGTITSLMPEGNICYGATYANPFSLQIEQAGSASQSAWPAAQIQATAKLIAYWAKKYNIPIQQATPILAAAGTPPNNGVMMHSQINQAPISNHSDPGSNYPFDQVLAKAKNF